MADDTDRADDGAERTRTGAQAVERAMAILRCFDDADDDLGISEIATRTGLRVSTAHRIVRALCGDGFMDQDRRTDRYRLGRTLVLLGQRASAQLGLEAVRPTLERLAAATGESVALGTVAAARLCVSLGLLREADRQRIVAAIEKAGLPTGGMALDRVAVVDAMAFDKKVSAGKLRFVLLDGIGRAVVRDDVPVDRVRQAVDSLM